MGRRRMLSGKGYFHVAAGGATAWNNSDRSVDIALTNSFLTATHSVSGNSYRAVRATGSASSGKKYYKLTLVTLTKTPGDFTVGFGNASASLSNYAGSDTNSLGWGDDGAVIINNASIGGGAGLAYAQGDILELEWDLTGQLVFVRINSGNWNNNASADPTTGVGGFSTSTLAAGPYFPMVAPFHDAPNDSATADFVSTAPSALYGNW